MNICLLTCPDLEGHITEEGLLKAQLESLGHQVVFQNWIDLKEIEHDLYVIRTTWDYTKHLELFLDKLKIVSPRLVNPYPLVKWNSNKRYLLDLQEKGVQTIPLRIINNNNELQTAMNELGGNEFVVKPLVGASAWGLKRFDRNSLPDVDGELILQRFLPEIVKGEISLFFFNREFGYACEKVPRPGDIRVQEEYGGVIQQVSPSDELLKIAYQAIQSIEFEHLYARVDIVPNYGIIEIECIEPSMYYSKAKDAVKMFAESISSWRVSKNNR